MILELLVFSCPFLLCSMAALYTEFTGTLAIYLEGLITFSAFLFYFFTLTTSSFLFASIITSVLIMCIMFLFSLFLVKTSSNFFIASIALNLLFGGLSSFLSSLIYNTRGVLVSNKFFFSQTQVHTYSLFVTVIFLLIATYALFFTQKGIYFRTTGSQPELLIVKGMNPNIYKIASWTISGIFACQAGIFLAMQVSSFVPNISSSRGWTSLAAVFLGKKKIWKIILFVLIFCTCQFFSANIQSVFPNIPNALLISLPYLVVLVLSLF